MRDGFLFGVATYFLFLFFKWGKLSNNKNPSMTPVRKKQFMKLDFWVWIRLPIRKVPRARQHSSRPEIRSLLVHWVHQRIWVEDQSIPPPPSGYIDDKTHAILVVIWHAQKINNQNNDTYLRPQPCAVEMGQSINTSV